MLDKVGLSADVFVVGVPDQFLRRFCEDKQLELGKMRVGKKMKFNCKRERLWKAREGDVYVRPARSTRARLR